MKIDCISKYEDVINHLNYSRSLSHFFFNDSIDQFKIRKQRDGKYPAIITISGFLSEDVDNRLNWQNSILSAFPDHEWFHLEWNTQKSPFAKKFNTDKPEIYKSPKKRSKFKKIILMPLIVIPVIGQCIAISKAIINNWWHLAVRNSKHTGILLSEILKACNHKEFIIVGHSLGARVIYNCLEHLAKNNVKTNVKEVHLLGGAVNNRVVKWQKSENTVKELIYNYYSNNDKILKYLYSRIMIDSFPIGLQKIEMPFVVNIDSTKYISGHTEYIPNFHIIKNK